MIYVIIDGMSSKNTIARRKYWASLTKEQRQERARKMVQARWKKMTKKQRSEHARKLVSYRWGGVIHT